MNVVKSIGRIFAILLLSACALATHAVPIAFEVSIVYYGEAGFDTVAFAFRLPNSDFAWDDPAFDDDTDLACTPCDGLLFEDLGWTLQDTFDPLVAGASGPAIVDGEIWGAFALRFFADPVLYPSFELDAIVFDSQLNPMNPQFITLTYDAVAQQYAIDGAGSSDWTPDYDAVFSVPEAGTLVLLGIGIAVFGLAGRRKLWGHSPFPSH